MRIWDLPPTILCRQHLLAEHRELHAIWNIITRGKKGYAHHPETLRWKGKLKALFSRHEAQVREFARRGYHHRTPLAKRLARGSGRQRVFVDRPSRQLTLLRHKGCACRTGAGRGRKH